VFRTLRMSIFVAATLVLSLFARPALAQSHVRGTLAAVKDDTIAVQTLKGGNENIKLAGDVAFFLVTKSDMKAVQSASSSASLPWSAVENASQSRCTSLRRRCAVWPKVITPGTLTRKRT
jgi:hypothetical protein